MPFPEKKLIARIRRRAGVAGVGDDCAVLRLPPGHEALVTTDFSLEGIHFRREWHPAESVGHRCLTRGLSDIAAMGGEARAAFLSLAVPGNLPQDWVDRFFAGLLKLAGAFKIPLAGGDTAESPDGVLADIVVLGSVPRGQAILRSGAGVGDGVYVTGELGGAATALQRMMERPRKRLNPRDFERHFFPQPRLRVGRFLRERGLASAMIDISDGFSTDLAHVCEESGVGAQIHGEAIPRAGMGKSGESDIRDALHGGDDYELLFTAPPGRRVPGRIAGVTVTRIGQITRGKKIVLRRGGIERELVAQGWEHFGR